MHVDFDALRLSRDISRKGESATLEAFGDDGETTPRPQQQFHLRLASIQKNEDVAIERVLRKRLSDFIRQPLK